MFNMYNIKHNNLNKPMKDAFEISNKEFHILRSNDVKFHIPKPKTNFMIKVLAILGLSVAQFANGSKRNGE